MKNVLQTCRPKKGIVEGTLNLEIFTASLGPVIDFYHHKGERNIDSIYTDAIAFFRDATYPTDGLKQIVNNVFRRIHGDAGVPAIYRLETAFGGGKTHSLISCVHIAYRGTELREVTKDILAPEFLPTPGTVSVVGIAGDELDVQKTTGDEIHPYTIWGEMAYQIGGDALYDEVKKEAESYASPGKSFFDKVLGNKKIIIMIDELAQYASRLEVVLPDSGADQLSAFLMMLNNYAKNHTGISVIVTLASSSDAFAKQTVGLAEKLNEIQATDTISDEDATAIMERSVKSVSSVINREATVVTPVQANEISLILAKRLFDSIDTDASKEVIAAYQEMYHRNENLLPEEANTFKFAKRMQSTYPFHPTFIDFLNNKLSLAENFQGTRGVLRVLALTISSIWRKKLPIMLIHTCHIDLRNAETVSEILGRTGNADLRVALNTDIGSVETNSLAGNMSQAERADEKNPHPDHIKMYELTWKTVFLNSLIGRAEGKTSKVYGINQQDAIFMTSTPILTPVQVKIALDEISKSAFYLRYEDGKYFAHQDPTLNSVLAMIRQNVDEKSVRQKLKIIASNLIEDNHLFNVIQDVRLPQDIPDNIEKLAVGVVSLDADSVDPMEFFTTKGNAVPRVDQNMFVLLIPKTVEVTLPNVDNDMFHNSDPVRQKSKGHIEDLARQVIAYQRLKDAPQAYGIQPSKLHDADFVEKSHERAMALENEVASLYNKMYFAMGPDIKVVEFRTSASDSGATILAQVSQELIDAGKLIWKENEPFKATELKSLAEQFLFSNGDRASIQDTLKRFQTLRTWPMLSSKKVLDRMLREGVQKGNFIVYRMGNTEDMDMPEEIYTQEKPVSMNVNLLNGGYSLMTLQGAKVRHWLDRDHVPKEKVQQEIKNILQASGAATVKDLTDAVQNSYGNVTGEEVKECIKEVAQSSGYASYEGEVDQQEKPEKIISGLDIPFHEFIDTDVIITKASESERGWLIQNDNHDLLANLNESEKAKKIYDLLPKVSSWYRRGKATADIKFLDLGGLRLPSGATMRISFDNLTPVDIQKLDEFFDTLTNISKPNDDAYASIEVEDTSNDKDMLIQELKK